CSSMGRSRRVGGESVGARRLESLRHGESQRRHAGTRRLTCLAGLALALIPAAMAVPDDGQTAPVVRPALGGNRGPYGVAFTPDGRRAYVSVSQLDQVAVIEVAGRRVAGTIPMGRRPRALAITPDGATVVAANMSAGSVSFLDTATLRERAQGPTPAVNMRCV